MTTTTTTKNATFPFSYSPNKKLKFIALGGANAGKSSILRRYFYGRFDDSRMPTMGADYFAKKVSVIENEDEEKKGKEKETGLDTMQHHRRYPSNSEDVIIQFWDTPGRERYCNLHHNITSSSSSSMYSSQKSSTTTTTTFTASFSDHFLKNMNAAIMVYDVSSSTSFTHVLKWHTELQERLERMKDNGQRARPLPILVVGNKIDIVEERQRQKQKQQKSTKGSNSSTLDSTSKPPQLRNVMGFRDPNHPFRGHDYRYEYTASSSPSTTTVYPAHPCYYNKNNNSSGSFSTTAPTQTVSSSTTPKMEPKTKSSTSSSSSKLSSSRTNRVELSTYMGTATNTMTNYLEAILSNEIYRGSYLDSVLSSEEKSHPDHDLVLLWCMRNGLQHVNVSAKTGQGIEELMQRLIHIAQQTMDPNENNEEEVGAETTTAILERSIASSSPGITKNDTKKNASSSSSGSHSMKNFTATTSNTTITTTPFLDLHQRYAPKPQRPCFGILSFLLPTSCSWSFQDCGRRTTTIK